MTDDTTILPTSDGHHNRADLAMARRAIRFWKLEAEWTDKLPEVAVRIAADAKKGDRERLRAVEVVSTMMRDNLNTLVQLDKMERLDTGQATERHEISPTQTVVRRIMENPKALRAALDAAKALDEAARDSGT